MDDINIKKFNEIKAFKTKDFGEKYWYVLFTMVLGGTFPLKVDLNNKKHKEIIKYYKYTIKGLIYTLPCSICRESYNKFYYKNNINNFLTSKIKLAYWLYLLKDMVNKKLIKQELESGKVQTKTSPSFKEVLQKYYNIKASGCSNKYKKCM